MTDNNLFSNVPATNGLARGYGPRPHKRKRKGLRFALVVLLLAVAGVFAASCCHSAIMMVPVYSYTVNGDSGREHLQATACVFVVLKLLSLLLLC